jgi:hypothetical protein
MILSSYLIIRIILYFFHQMDEKTALVRVSALGPYPVPTSLDFKIKFINPSFHISYTPVSGTAPTANDQRISRPTQARNVPAFNPLLLPSAGPC